MVSPLISVSDLARHDTQDTVIFDCRFSLANPQEGEQQYLNAHLPGAHYIHLNRDLSGPLGEHGGRHPLPATEAFTALMQSHGVNRETPVIAYDDHGFAFAARLWWLLRYFGHRQVQVLNGGMRAWIEAGQPVTSDVAIARAVGDFIALPNENWVVDYHNVKDGLYDPERLLIDAREERRYQGLEEPIDPIAGNIPGARNYPWQGVTDNLGVALPTDQQQKRWQNLPNDKELVVYCGSGVTACVNLLSLQLAGLNNAKLYAGSWSDWCSYQVTETKKEETERSG